MTDYYDRYSNLINPVEKSTDITDLELAHYDYTFRYNKYTRGPYKYLRNYRFFRYYYMVNIVYIESLIQSMDRWLTDNIYHFEP